MVFVFVLNTYKNIAKTLKTFNIEKDNKILQQVQVTLISWQPHGSSSTLGEIWWKDKRNQAASDLYRSTTPIPLFFLLTSESSFSYSRKMIVINRANNCNIDDDHDDNDDNCCQSYPCTWFLL